MLGTELWHVHPRAYAATAFNPRSKNRFAVVGARSSRAMYYAGQTAEVAIWETILRDTIADVDGCAAVYEAQLADRVLSRVRTIEPVQLVDLSMPRLRVHVGDDAELAEWQELQRTPDYSRTHRAAASVLSKTKSLGAFRWTSKQAGNGAAYVFYARPHGESTFKVLAEHRLDGRRRWYWIDRALSQAGIQRISTDPTTLLRLT